MQDLGPILRMSATGNSFFIVDLFEKKIKSKAPRGELVKKMCKGYDATLADGVVFLEKANQVDFSWDFYNADGTEAEMCGNAARCAVRYFYDSKLKKELISFRAGKTQVVGKILPNDQVEVTMPKLVFKGKCSIKKSGKIFSGYFVNSGVPHFVLEGRANFETASFLRAHPMFGQGGTNVTFVESKEPNIINAVTFERGVEGFTLSCGTGAIAAAAAMTDLDGQLQPISVNMPGGQLQVKLGDTPSLTGPAAGDFEIIFKRNLL